MQLALWSASVFAALLLTLPTSHQVSPSLPSVDLSIRELGDHRPLLVSTRTNKDVWLVRGRAPIQVWRSADTGRSWRVDATATQALKHALTNSAITLDFLVWLTPEIGISAGYIGAQVLRTTDAGRSWQAIPLTDPLWVYDVEHVGKRAWLCGSSGRIFRSDDAGARWHELQGSPFNDNDRCMDMSFLTPESGWAVGRRGSLWATKDGGKSWLSLATPEQSPLSQGGTSTPEDLRVVRLTPQVAWLQGSGVRFRTTDGGKTWHSRPSPVITAGPTRRGLSIEQWVPFLGKSQEAAPLGKNTVLTLGKHGVYTYAAGQLLRASPPVSRGTGDLTPLEGIARKAPDEWLGWAGDQIVASHDEGRSWFRVGQVPRTPLREIVFLKDDETILAESGQGTLLRSVNFGRSWHPTTNPLDSYDFAVASGRGASPEAPFNCVLTTSPASLTVRFEAKGCFNANESLLTVKLLPDEAELSGERDGREHVEFKQSLSRTEGERIVRDVLAAATRQETQRDCVSTTSYTAAIEWSCPSGRIKEGKMSVRASHCEPLDLNGYSRALGIHQVASAIFVGAGR